MMMGFINIISISSKRKHNCIKELKIKLELCNKNMVKCLDNAIFIKRYQLFFRSSDTPKICVCLECICTNIFEEISESIDK